MRSLCLLQKSQCCDTVLQIDWQINLNSAAVTREWFRLTDFWATLRVV
jgi:hypothetical protein